MFGSWRSETSKSRTAANRFGRGSAPDIHYSRCRSRRSVKHLRTPAWRRPAALTAIVGGKDGADTAARPPRKAGARPARRRCPSAPARPRPACPRRAADHQHRVDPVLEHHFVVVRAGNSIAASTIRRALSVTDSLSPLCTPEQPSRMSAPPGDQRLEQPVETAVGEILRAAAEDERPGASSSISSSSEPGPGGCTRPASAPPRHVRERPLEALESMFSPSSGALATSSAA